MNSKRLFANIKYATPEKIRRTFADAGFRSLKYMSGIVGNLPVHEIASFHSQGFFRPYALDQKGVAPEAWHLSYAPVSEDMLQDLNFKVFEEVLEREIYRDLDLYHLVLEHAEEIYRRFVLNITPPQWPAATPS